jgi:predicted TIM-barrel fold metal-dependent hydrolase
MTATVDSRVDVSVDRYLVVSCDCHVGPSLTDQLRQYCPAEHLEAFDVDVVAGREAMAQRRAAVFNGAGALLMENDVAKSPGLQDPHARIRELDADGVACEVLFAGGQNAERLPFVSHQDPSKQALGYHIYNQWLADFCSVEPDRHIGVAQVPMWDVAAAVAEVDWAAEHGLRSVNFPVPRDSLKPYNDPSYEPFWAAVAANGMTLNCHGAPPPDMRYTGEEATAILQSEAGFFGTRALPYLVWGGVFERYPNLKLVLTEQGADWVANALRHWDSIWYSKWFPEVVETIRRKVPRLPSEYFRENIFIARSFMARYELEDAVQGGYVDNMLWGSDMPHIEGTWPNTEASLRMTFSGIPTPVVAKVLGATAVDVFGLDGQKLRAIADRIGPRVSDIDHPLQEVPAGVGRSQGFRTRGPVA